MREVTKKDINHCFNRNFLDNTFSKLFQVTHTKTEIEAKFEKFKSYTNKKGKRVQPFLKYCAKDKYEPFFDSEDHWAWLNVKQKPICNFLLGNFYLNKFKII